MRVISQSELLRLTRTELSVLLRKIACELPNLAEGSVKLRNAHANLLNIRRACAAGLPATLWQVGTLRLEGRLLLEQSGNGSAGSCVMSNKSWARPQAASEANPKIDPAPNSNTEKEPDDWVSGEDPMTGAQASYLKTLSEECGEPDSFQADLTKAEASKRIDALKSKRRPVQHR